MALGDPTAELTGDREHFWAKPHDGQWVKPS
jgi:hypothetical protein